MAERLLGYCTNVHAGASLQQTQTNLQQYAVRVRQLLGDTQPLPIGLWLSAAACADLDGDQLLDFRDWLSDQQLRVFTINGFPYSDFHQPVVKHAVYEPDWTTPERYNYTLQLARILSTLLPEGDCGSISTLPLGWGPNPTLRRDGAAALQRLSQDLSDLGSETGRCIHVDLEPEPGCSLGDSSVMLHWYRDELLPGAGDEHQLRRHIRICHDVCHAAVMFESQTEVLANYRSAGIPIGKVQLSSAPRIAAGAKPEALEMLQRFHEPRYLHQTCVKRGQTVTFYEDLPQALRGTHDGDWRVHFHVPIHLERCGPLDTTQADIGEVLTVIGDDVVHFEVETYAWSVLPDGVGETDLSEGIAAELRWARTQLAAR